MNKILHERLKTLRKQCRETTMNSYLISRYAKSINLAYFFCVCITQLPITLYSKLERILLIDMVEHKKRS